MPKTAGNIAIVSSSETVSLSISVVLFHSRLDLLSIMLKSTLLAFETARKEKLLGEVSLRVIDNSMNLDYAKRAQAEINRLDISSFVTLGYESNKKNEGFGFAHNQVILYSESDIH